MLIRAAWFSILIALACSTGAHAAKNVEVVQIPSLLMLGGLSQTVGASYNYSGHKTAGSSTSSSNLREHYSLGTEAAILDPHLVALELTGRVSYYQQFEQKTSLLDYEYDVIASLFDLSHHPVTLGAVRSTSVVSNGYTPSYTLTNDVKRLHASLLHSIIPLTLSLSSGTTASKGLGKDTTQTSNSLAVAASHHSDRSRTSASFSYDAASSEGNDSNRFFVSLNNDLDLDEGKKYQLNTNAHVNESKSADVLDKSAALSENLTCRFGPALTGTLSDNYNYSSTLRFDGQPQTAWSNSLSAGLNHQLYRSLTTNISGFTSQGSLLGGSQEGYGFKYGLLYTKSLPAQSLLTVSGNVTEQVARQKLIDSQFFVPDESHQGVQQGDEISPRAEGRLTSVTRVKSLVGLPPSQIEVVYLEGSDYLVDLLLGRITITRGGSIAPGTDLLISYTVELNPSVKFTTQAKRVATNLSLLSGRYTFGANLSVQDQSLLSGEASKQALSNSTIFDLRAEANLGETTFGATYSNYDSTQQAYSRLATHWRLSRKTDAGASLSFGLSDSYTMYAGERGSEAYSINSLSGSASYARSFFRFLRFSSSLVGGDVRGGKMSSNFLMLRTGVSGSYNQLTFSLNAMTKYRFSGGETNVDDSLQCSISRYF